MLCRGNWPRGASHLSRIRRVNTVLQTQSLKHNALNSCYWRRRRDTMVMAAATRVRGDSRRGSAGRPSGNGRGGYRARRPQLRAAHTARVTAPCSPPNLCHGSTSGILLFGLTRCFAKHTPTVCFRINVSVSPV